jgi:uncharacterized protein
MRLSIQKANLLIRLIKEASPTAQIFLFGSRVDDTAKGGDIDICIISVDRIPCEVLAGIRIAFFKRFGFQKLDLLNYTNEEKSTFKSIIFSHAVRMEERM